MVAKSGQIKANKKWEEKNGKNNETTRNRRTGKKRPQIEESNF